MDWNFRLKTDQGLGSGLEMGLGVRVGAWERTNVSKIVNSSPDVTLRPAKQRLPSRNVDEGIL